jgi:Flp pilus assembly protein TadG
MLWDLRAIGRTLRRFGRARRGATAIEFAIVVVPFFLLTFGLAEVAMIGFAQTTLDYAVSQVARKVRTGEDQMTGITYAQIQTQLCDEVNSFMVLTCNANLYFDVSRYDSFVDAGNNQAQPIQNNQFTTTGFAYNPGVASDIVVVRAYYRWQVLTPLFQPIFQNISGGQRILVSTMMFRNEPYQQ